MRIYFIKKEVGLLIFFFTWNINIKSKNRHNVKLNIGDTGLKLCTGLKFIRRRTIGGFFGLQLLSLHKGIYILF